MADELQASPQIGWMQAIADKLRSGSRKLGQVNPLAGYLASQLSEPAARGAENWSYGDKLLGPTNTPMVNSRTEDMLAAVPTLPSGSLNAAGSAASKAAFIVPILRNFNKIPEKAGLLERKALKAEELLQKGATPQDIWQDLQVEQIPRTNTLPRAALEAKWGHEVAGHPADPLFTPYASMSQNDKIDFLHSDMPSLVNPASPTYVLHKHNVLKNEMLLPGNYKAGDVLEHPAMTQYGGMLNDVDLEFLTNKQFKNPALWNDKGAAWAGSPPKIGIYHGSTIDEASKGASPRSTVIHELQHVLQRGTGMPGGGSPGGMGLDAQGIQQQRLTDLVNALRAKNDSLADNVAQQLGANIQAMSFSRYQNLMGERQARAAQLRDTWSPQARADTRPSMTIGGRAAELDPQVWDSALSAISSGSTKPTDWANLLLHRLRPTP